MTGQREYDERMQLIREHWPELAQQDRWANGGGMEIDLLAAWMYAERDGIPFERYIIDVLRAERIRRSEQDGLMQNLAMLDDLIDDARAANMGVLVYAATEYGDHDGDTAKLARDFVEKIVSRLEDKCRHESLRTHVRDSGNQRLDAAAPDAVARPSLGLVPR